MLLLYAVAFSYAYLSLDTATGALILFGAVQITIVVVALLQQNRPVLLEWLGLLVALAGFVYLVLPQATRPDLGGALVMLAAGIGWGLYTVLGRSSQRPLADTAWNFMRASLALPLLALLIYLGQLQEWSGPGFWLALVSGALTSGVGYAIWYAALRGLSALQAGVVQLIVPVLAALGGVLFVQEPLSFQLVVAAVLILGGIALLILGRARAAGRQIATD